MPLNFLPNEKDLQNISKKRSAKMFIRPGCRSEHFVKLDPYLPDMNLHSEFTKPVRRSQSVLI
jgi:hypothetical protein